MAQHDYDVGNAAGAPFRADINAALTAVVTANSGATAPNPTFAFMWWADTTAGLLKQRNAANSAWINVLSLATGLPVNAPPAAGFFQKADPATVAFTKTGAGTANIKAGTVVEVVGSIITYASATTVVMPTLVIGTDYAVYAATDGTCRADSSFTAPLGYSTANTRRIGGFHYAAGDNAAARAGGNTTANINAFSFYDLKYKPSCGDARGMALIGGAFWSDIYMCGVDHQTNGTSRYNVSIADGSSAPKLPTAFGGNGSLTYTELTWWNGSEILRAYGKRLPSYDQFAALAYGSTEAISSGGSDVPTTGVNGTGFTSAWNVFTSQWGVIQATGNLWTWGDEFGGGAAGAAWTANTGGRGSTFQMENAVLLGGNWGDGANSGSRCSAWNNAPPDSGSNIGVRGVCDHLVLE